MKYVLYALLVALPCAAQEQKSLAEISGDPITKFIDLKYLRGERLQRVTLLASQLHPHARMRFVSDNLLGTFAIVAQRPGDLAIGEALIRRFDVPAAAEEPIRQVQLTVTLLEPVDEIPPGQSVPAELLSAVEQLRKTFGHKNLRVVDSIIMQARENAMFETSGILPSLAGKYASPYSASFVGTRYQEAQKLVSVNRFSFKMSVPSGADFVKVGVDTDLTIKEGQKLVLGKIARGQSEPSNYLVVTAKVE